MLMKWDIVEINKIEGDKLKYHIEKNTVQETLIIPLYGRKMCSEIFSKLFYDQTAINLINQIDYDFSELEKKSKSKMQQFGFLEVAMRQNDLTYEIKDYLKTHPKAAIVNLGCGLDDSGHNADNGLCKIYNLDFPDVIKVRNELIPERERETNIGCNLNDYEWFDKIDASNGVVFFAAGVFYYFTMEQVKNLVKSMANAFPGGKLVFDGACKKAVKLMLKTWIKEAKIKDVNAYFYVSNAKKELSLWSEKLKVSSKGYMLGYQKLDDPSVRKLYRFLAKVGDKLMKMQIIRIDFLDNNSTEE